MRFARILFEKLKRNFSTFQLFNLSPRAAAIAAAALTAAAAMADSATDSAIRMEETGIAAFGHVDYVAPTAAYPTAASGTIADEANSSASATSATTSWSLSAWSVGRMISEQPPDAKVGEFLTRFPREAGEVDWDATFAAIRASEAGTNGYIQVIGGTTNLNEMLLITRSGAMAVPFVLKDGTRVLRDAPRRGQQRRVHRPVGTLRSFLRRSGGHHAALRDDEPGRFGRSGFERRLGHRLRPRHDTHAYGALHRE